MYNPYNPCAINHIGIFVSAGQLNRWFLRIWRSEGLMFHTHRPFDMTAENRSSTENYPMFAHQKIEYSVFHCHVEVREVTSTFFWWFQPLKKIFDNWDHHCGRIIRESMLYLQAPRSRLATGLQFHGSKPSWF